MRQMNQKRFTLLAGLILPFFFLLMLLPGAEAEELVFEPIRGTETTFTEAIVLDRDPHVPNAAFSLSVTPGKAIRAGSTTLEVRAGVGTPVLTEVVFSEGDKTYTKSQTGDGISLSAGQKYTRKEVTVDFSGIEYQEPGVYRYVITEHCEGFGLVPDEDPARTMDVYVQAQGDHLGVLGYVMYKGDKVAAPAPTMEAAGATKSRSFVNTYATQNLSFGTEAKGIGSEKERAFVFTLKITGAEAGTVYDVELSPQDSAAEPRPLKVGLNGSAVRTYYLRDGQYITVKGLARGTAYEITQKEEEDYATASGTKAVAIPASGKKHSRDYVPAKLYSDPTSGTVGTEDIHTGYTNTWKGSSKTIFLLTFSGTAIIIIVIGVIFALRRRRRRKRFSTRGRGKRR